MKMKFWFIILCLLLIQIQTTNSEETKIVFSFITTENENKSIEEYYDKPVLVEWAASWCNACKKNQEAINEIYSKFTDRINFLSISVFLSEDTIEDVREMKKNRNYNWTFGLDINGSSNKYQVFNGDTWLIDTSGKILERWNRTLVSESILIDSFERHLQITNEEYSEQNNTSFRLLPVLTTIIILTKIFRKNKSPID